MSNLELCCECDEPTGRAGLGEDSLYAGDHGPYCEDCWEIVPEELAARVARLERVNVRAKGEADALRAALEDIAGIGFDAPMTWAGTDEEWERRRANIMQSFARAALKVE